MLTLARPIVANCPTRTLVVNPHAAASCILYQVAHVPHKPPPLAEIEPDIASPTEPLMKRPIALLRTLSRLAIHPTTIVMDNKKSLVGVERLTVDSTEIVPYVPVRVHAVFDLVDRPEGTVTVDTNRLRASIVLGDAGCPEASVWSQNIELADSGAPGVLDVDIEVTIVLDVSGARNCVSRASRMIRIDGEVK